MASQALHHMQSVALGNGLLCSGAAEGMKAHAFKAKLLAELAQSQIGSLARLRAGGAAGARKQSLTSGRLVPMVGRPCCPVGSQLLLQRRVLWHLPGALGLGGGLPIGHLLGAHVGPGEGQSLADTGGRVALHGPQAAVARAGSRQKRSELLVADGSCFAVASDFHAWSCLLMLATLLALLPKEQAPSSSRDCANQGLLATTAKRY